MKISTIFASVTALFLPAFSVDTLDAADAPVNFQRDIRPILSDNCFFCHGPDDSKREADLRLDTRTGLFGELTNTGKGKQKKTTPPVIPGKPAGSELIQRIRSTDEYTQMPPLDSGKQLTKAEIDVLEKWVAQGAPFTEHWAYVQPVSPPIPEQSAIPAAVNAIDNFIGAKISQQGLEPVGTADRITLIRRVTFDLTGLPPTPAEVHDFLEDTADDAWEKVIDRLLNSPHFGERMAVGWLDLVRYADTVGYHGDQDHNISPYRDYVIQAFNNNLPFDQFTIDQLAGDLLVNPTDWQIIATGYNRLLQTSHEGGVQQKEYLAKYLADRVRNVSAVWLGATIGCAECHDHKFDPYTQTDFYSLGAFFADVDELGTFKGTNSLPTKRPPEIPVLGLMERQLLENIDEELEQLQQQQDAPEKLARIKQLQSDRAAVAKRKRTTMITRSVQPRVIRVLPRGNWLDDTGAIVQPAIPARFGKLQTSNRATRLELARWLVSAENPLTARVMVNRWWKQLFGRGLSPSLEDFGAQGTAPTHPELLDWLARRFQQGWNVKAIVKLMVMSRTYQLSSVPTPQLIERDPQNQFFARQSRWRVEAEFVRDNALAVSGLLVRDVGGASAKPYQPAGYYQHLNFPQRKYTADTGNQQYRRGLYTHWQRVFLHPMLKAFDAPSREECTADRSVSNTPLAALVLLNDPTFVEAARALATRVLQKGGDNFSSRLEWLYQTVVSRRPSPQEVRLLKSLYTQDLKDYQTDIAAAASLLKTGQSKPPQDLDQLELAAWTSLARALLNLNEAITRN